MIFRKEYRKKEKLLFGFFLLLLLFVTGCSAGGNRLTGFVVSNGAELEPETGVTSQASTSDDSSANAVPDSPLASSDTPTIPEPVVITIAPVNISVSVG